MFYIFMKFQLLNYLPINLISINKAARVPAQSAQQHEGASTNSACKKMRVWERFDHRTVSLVQDDNPRATAIIEVK